MIKPCSPKGLNWRTRQATCGGSTSSSSRASRHSRRSSSASLHPRAPRSSEMIKQSEPTTLAVPPQPTDHSLGSEHAQVTIVEYGDYACPSCKLAAPTPALLLERYPNKIRFIYRHF